MREEFKIAKLDGKRRNPHEQVQFDHCLKEILKAEMFEHTTGRNLVGLPNFSRNIFSNLDPNTLKQWIEKHKKNWDFQNKHYYTF